MRVRSPASEQWAGYPEDQPGSARAIHTPMATEDSFTTAPDVDETNDAYDAFDEYTPTAGQHHAQESSWRSSTYSYSGPHAL